MIQKAMTRHKSSRLLKPNNSIYELFGINDVSAFYAHKFVWTSPPNIVAHDPLSKFDIAYLKQYWIYNNIREGAKVLDVGCGSGTLNLLKSKNVYLIGTDLSEEALEQALRAGYDEAVLCDSFEVPYPDNSFDYVVSLDLLGHIENEIKDVYLKEWMRLLATDGVMLHGIETGDIDYSNLTDKHKEHLMIDGHVGLESFEKVVERFRKFFSDVVAENLMGSCYNWHDIYKYPITEDRVGKEFREFLLTFTPEQIRGFNAAMLLMRNLLSKDNLLGDSGGFMFISASKKALPR